MCRSMFTRFADGQELLRRNHGVPVLDQQGVLDRFIDHLNTECRVPAEVTEMLQRMRRGSLLNNAGGTAGGRLQMTQACMNKEPAFYQIVLEAFFRPGPSSHYELFPSTTKSIEAFVALLAHESELRERPIKVLLPSDAHYCWRNIMNGYRMHPLLTFWSLEVGSSGVSDVRMREQDFIVPVFTLANTVSGRTTDVKWFQSVLEHVETQGATPHVFVDAALFGCTIARDTLDLRADAPPADVAKLLSGAFGIVQSGFKDYGLSSMLFLDDAPLESCADRKVEAGLASAVAGGAHALIKHAPVTSIPEAPTLSFLIFSREYTAFRRKTFSALVDGLEKAIPEGVEHEIRPLFPLLHVEFANHETAAALTAALMGTYSLITIDAEPGVLRLWPTPTNGDVVEAIGEWFQSEALDI